MQGWEGEKFFPHGYLFTIGITEVSSPGSNRCATNGQIFFIVAEANVQIFLTVTDANGWIFHHTSN